MRMSESGRIQKEFDKLRSTPDNSNEKIGAHASMFGSFFRITIGEYIEGGDISITECVEEKSAVGYVDHLVMRMNVKRRRGISNLI